MYLHIIYYICLDLYLKAYTMDVATFVKTKRKQLGFTQEELAEKAGVALTVIRKIEQKKDNLSLAKVNEVLALFGHQLGPIPQHEANL